MAQTTFDQRVTHLETKHRRLSDGVTYRIGADGLITAQPYRRFSPRFPARGLLLLIAGGFVFKAALLFASGEATYESRLAQMEQGQAVERAMAVVMQPDPVSRGLAAAVAAVQRAAPVGMP